MEIPRVPRLSREEFEDAYLARGRPVIVTGGAAAWGTDGPWTPERLRQALGARAVKVASSERDVFGYDETEAAYQVEEMAFGAAADLITRVQPSERRYYLMQQSLPREFPELAALLRPPDCVGSARAHPHLWFGSEGNLTPLHYDMANNAFGQMHGRKRFLLFDPAQSELLYPREAGSRHHNLSQLDPEQPDPARFPRFAEAEGWTGEVGPGDMLYLPAFWWHQVRSLEMGVSVSVWWSPRPEQFMTPMARRMTPVLYERDRLLTLKAMVAEPGPHQGFLGMARFMAARGEAALAVLFAGAALEDALRLLYLKHVKPSETAALRDSVRMGAALGQAGALSPEEPDTLARWAAHVAQALKGEAIAAADAEAMAAGVAEFTERHKR